MNIDPMAVIATLDRDQLLLVGHLHEENARLADRVRFLEGQVADLETAQTDRVRLLTLAAVGRREYAESAPHPGRTILLGEAEVLDSAIKIVRGDITPLYGLLPSWRWGEAGLS